MTHVYHTGQEWGWEPPLGIKLTGLMNSLVLGRHGEGRKDCIFFFFFFLRFPALETSLVVQWLRFCAASAGGTGLIPGWGTKILHAARHGKKGVWGN